MSSNPTLRPNHTYALENTFACNPHLLQISGSSERVRVCMMSPSVSPPAKAPSKPPTFRIDIPTNESSLAVPISAPLDRPPIRSCPDTFR